MGVREADRREIEQGVVTAIFLAFRFVTAIKIKNLRKEEEVGVVISVHHRILTKSQAINALTQLDQAIKKRSFERSNDQRRFFGSKFLDRGHKW